MSPTLREDIGTAEQRARPWPVDGTPGITTRTSDLFHRLDCPAFHRGHRAAIEVERVTAEAAGPESGCRRGWRRRRAGPFRVS